MLQSPGEACERFDVSNNGCSQSCTVECGFTCDPVCESECGDGILAIGEACDDENTADNDGCSSTCSIEIGYACVVSAICSASTCSEVCGDGKRVGDEACDDGNTISSDGCSSVCAVETACGYSCNGGSPTQQDTCETSCGDSMWANPEGCDDGNVEDGDGCSSSCEVEVEWVCSNSECNESTCSAETGEELCGDGKQLGSEVGTSNFCDDAGTIPGDGCSATCTVECGYQCNGGDAETADTCFTTCGGTPRTC